MRELAALGLVLKSEHERWKVEGIKSLVPPRTCAAESDACMTLESAGSSVPSATMLTFLAKAFSPAKVILAGIGVLLGVRVYTSLRGPPSDTGIL